MRKGWYGVDKIDSVLCSELLRRVSSLETYGNDIYVLGSVFEPWTSWDVDIKVTGYPETRLQWDRTYELLWYISQIGFALGLYIDCSFANTIDLSRINCGGMNDWDGEYRYEDVYEITNYYMKDDRGGVMEHYTPAESGLWKRNIQYPFKKNIQRYNEGYLYHQPVLIKDLV